MKSDPKTLAQKVAKQVAQEPLEVLKEAGNQVAGIESREPPEVYPQNQDVDAQAKIVGQQRAREDREKSNRGLEAYRQELKDINKENLFKDLQGKISKGVEIPLQDYPQLSLEQKQVLKAQMEAVKSQMENAKSANGKSLVEPATKKGRQLFNFGKKTEMKREQTHVEKIMPPSA
jgi:hypothetical protein